MVAFRYIEYRYMEDVRNLIYFLLMVLIAFLLTINSVLYFFLLLMAVLLDTVEQIMLAAQSLMVCARLLEALAFPKFELKKNH